MTHEEWSAQLAQKLENKESYSLQELAQQAIAEHPNTALFYYYLGEAHFLNWNYNDALAALQQSVALDSTNLNAQRRLAHATFKTGNETGGVELFQKLIAAHPDNGYIYLDLGRIYAEAWQGAKAIEMLTKAASLLPNEWEAHYLLARTLYSTELRAEEALPIANRAIELNRFNDTIDLRIAINRYLKKHEDCERDYKELIAMHPDHTQLYSNLAAFYSEIEAYDKADAAYTQAIEQEVKNGYQSYYSYQQRGEARLKAGNGTAAIADFNQAADIYLQQNPGNALDATILQLRAQAHEQMGNEEAAVKDLLQALEGESYQKTEIRKRLANLYIELQQWAEAEKHLKAMGEGDEWMKAQSLLELGKLYLAKGDVQQAYTTWKQAQEAGAYEAEGLIKTHCQSILDAQKGAQDDAIRQEFAEFAKYNGRSSFMAQLFGKFWQLDAERSLHFNLENNPFAMMLPDNMRGLMLNVLDDIRPLLQSVYFEFSAETIDIRTSLHKLEKQSHTEEAPGGFGNFKLNFDPSQFDGLKAYYKIVNESAEFATLYAKRTGGKGDASDARTLQLHLEGDVLRVEGLTGDKPLTLFFAPKTKEELPTLTAEEQTALFDRLKQRAQEFIVTLMGSMAQGFRNVVQNLDKDNEDDEDDDTGGQA